MNIHPNHLAALLPVLGLTLSAQSASNDCNGDGIEDRIQILDGSYEDLDGNWTLDCCDAGLACDEASPTSIYAPKIALGGGFGVGITQDGRVVTWGSGNNGILNVPAGIEDPVQVATWEGHILVLQADGRVIAWGADTYGQCQVPGDLAPAVSVAGLSRGSLALHPDGTVSGWGDDYWCGAGTSSLDMPVQSNIREIAGGNAHWLYRTASGMVMGRGCNWNGQWNVPGNAQAPADFEATESWSCVLSPSGTVHAFGWGGFGQLEVPSGSGWTDIATGAYFGLALNLDGTIAAWGRNDAGQCDPPAKLQGVRSVAAGSRFSAAIHADGSLTTWGSNSVGQCDWPSQERFQLHDVDCNGNGVADWRDLLEGTAEDLDGDGELDDCQNPETPCPTDLTGDRVTDAMDLGILLALRGTDGQDIPQADIDGDGIVCSPDLGLLLAGWGPCPE